MIAETFLSFSFLCLSELSFRILEKLFGVQGRPAYRLCAVQGACLMYGACVFQVFALDGLFASSLGAVPVMGI